MNKVEAAREWICSHNDGDVLYVKDAFVGGVDWAIDKACKHINDHWDKLLIYDYNQYGGCVFNRQKTVEQFKKAMEG